eukprot:g3809.t1
MLAKIVRVSSRSSSKLSRNFATGKQTALFDFHKENKGKLVDFAGYQLPVQYEGLGVMKEHLWTRSSASIFDVSHMGQLKFTGKDRAAFLETVVVGDIAGLENGCGRLSLITTERGTIIDDTIITNMGDHIFMVVNGACKEKDIAHIQSQMETFDGDVTLEHLDERSLIAIQGPKAHEALQRHASDLDLAQMDFMEGTVTTVAGIEGCTLVRCGYTGEDGFEIGIPNEGAASLTAALAAENEVQLAGLGARDSLRLEAGLCLYGNDLDEDTTPNEAALLWTIAKHRRKEGGFLGADVVQSQLGGKITRKRVGLVGMKAPARTGAEIFTADGSTKVGVVTSGTFSPTLKKPLAMGYVDKGHYKVGTELAIKVRGKLQAAEVAKMPFTPYGYYRK